MSTLSTTNLKNPSSGSNNIVLNADGTTTVTAPSNIIKSGTVNAGGTTPFPATGGPTAVDFTGIPSWVKRVTVMFSGVSTNGTSNIQVQLGAGSITSTGYVGGASSISALTNYSTGFVVSNSVSATDTLYGSMVLANITGNSWMSSYTAVASSVRAYWGAGQVALSGTLDRVRITTANGTDTFDAGSINILWEG